MIPLLLLAVLAQVAPAPRRPSRPSRPVAAPAAPKPDRWPLASLRIEGNKLLPSDAIVAATGLKPAQLINRADLEAAAARLTDSGVFETLSFRYTPTPDKQLAVIFQVQEVVDLYPVAFERLDQPDADLMQYLRSRLPLFGPQAPATGPMLRRITEALEARLPLKVSGRLQPGPDGALRLTFRPTVPPPSITFVRFTGTQVLRDVDLQGKFYQTVVGIPYTEPRLKELLDHNIRPLFEEKGRLRVRFGPFAVEESKEPSGVQITVPVQEGDEFHFGARRFEGHTRFPDKDLGKLAPLEPDAVANFALVHKAATDIERLYRRTGFLHVKVTPDRTIDDAKKSVDVVLGVREGDQFRLRTLTIKGLDINAEAAVRKRWGLQRAQPFDDTYPDVFIRRIQEEEMFDRLAKIIPRVVLDEAEKMVDVELTFVGAAPPKPTPLP